MRMLKCQGGDGIGAGNSTASLLFSQETSKHTVDESRGFAAAVALGRFDGFIDCGIGRNPIKIEELVECETEQVSDARLGLGQRPAQVSAEPDIDRAAPTQGTVGELGEQSAIRWTELGASQRLIEQNV